MVVLWGANWPIMKVGLDYIPPLWFAAARMLLGLACLFGLLAVRGRLVLPERRDLTVIASVGLLQMAGFLGLVNIGLLEVPAGRSALLAYTTPLWVTPAAVLLLGERLTPRKLAGLACGLGGLGILFNPLGFDWHDPAIVRGNLLLMLAALCWAGAILHVRLHRWRASPLQLAPWQMLAALPILGGLALLLEDPAEIRWTLELLAVLFFNGPLATAFCFWAAITVTRALPALSSSLGFLAVPVVGVALSTLALGEALTLSFVAGLILIVVGLALVNLPDRRAAKPP